MQRLIQHASVCWVSLTGAEGEEKEDPVLQIQGPAKSLSPPEEEEEEDELVITFITRAAVRPAAAGVRASRACWVIQMFLTCVQTLKGQPPPTPLFGEDEDEDDLDWMK